jgi:uncharacterized coiled-coil protein SlyX
MSSDVYLDNRIIQLEDNSRATEREIASLQQQLREQKSAISHLEHMVQDLENDIRDLERKSG